MTEAVEENKVSTRGRPKKVEEPVSSEALWVATRFSEHAVTVTIDKRTEMVKFQGHKLVLDLANTYDRKVHEALLEVVARKGLADVVLVRDAQEPNPVKVKAEMAAQLNTLHVNALRAFVSSKERNDAEILMALPSDKRASDYEKASLIALICDLKTLN